MAVALFDFFRDRVGPLSKMVEERANIEIIGLAILRAARKLCPFSAARPPATPTAATCSRAIRPDTATTRRRPEP